MIAFLLAAALGATGPAAAPQTAPAPASSPAKPAKDPRDVICRFEDKPGTRMRQKVCRTRAQWQAEEDAGDRFLSQTADRGALNPTSNMPTNMGAGY